MLQRAAGFFVDNNDNYKVSWAEASHRISQLEISNIREDKFAVK